MDLTIKAVNDLNHLSENQGYTIRSGRDSWFFANQRDAFDRMSEMTSTEIDQIPPENRVRINTSRVEAHIVYTDQTGCEHIYQAKIEMPMMEVKVDARLNKVAICTLFGDEVLHIDPRHLKVRIIGDPARALIEDAYELAHQALKIMEAHADAQAESERV